MGELFQGVINYVDLVHGRGLDIGNADRTLMAFICTAMPQHLKSQLFPLLVGCFGNPELFIQQSSSDYVNRGALPPFDYIHFSWYNRYTTKVISPCLIYTLHFSHAFAGYRVSQQYSSLRALPWQHQNKHLAAATIYVNRHGGICSNI